MYSDMQRELLFIIQRRKRTSWTHTGPPPDIGAPPPSQAPSASAPPDRPARPCADPAKGGNRKLSTTLLVMESMHNNVGTFPKVLLPTYIIYLQSMYISIYLSTSVRMPTCSPSHLSASRVMRLRVFSSSSGERQSIDTTSRKKSAGLKCPGVAFKREDSTYL